MCVKKMADLWNDNHPPVLPFEKVLLIAVILLSLAAIAAAIVKMLN